MEKNEKKWITGYIRTAAGDVPRISTKLDFSDIFGSWKCRWSIGRMDYKVEPGIYCVGTPDERDPVLVTANYKMTFDRLSQQLSGLNLWILVLVTDGVNVWCAAGKGTFGFEKQGNEVEITDRDKCMECGACARNCPFEAIEVHEGVGCAGAILLSFFTGEDPSCG